MTRSRTLHLAIFGLFFLLLVSPWLAGLFGATADTVEQRPPTVRPSLRGGAVLDVDTFAELNDWVRDATPLRGDATGWVSQAWLALDVSPKANVMEGPGDTFFLAEDFTAPCAREYELDEMTTQFAKYAEAAQAGGKEWLFLVAPDKGAVLDHRLSGRADWAASCSREARSEFRDALDATGVSFDLAPTLIEADQAEPGRWYYEHDSHWTFDAGDLVAEQIVNHFQAGLYDPSQLGTIDRSLPIRGDIYSRLGILKLRDEPDPVRSSLRSDVATELSEEQIGGTRTIRTYVSSGDGDVIPGRTVVMHDSMMNFAELQLASYFEHIEFIHWNDFGKASFAQRIADADRVIMMRVERDVHRTIETVLLDDALEDTTTTAASITAALRTARDFDLGLELQAATDALRRFTQDTGSFVQTFDDLLLDPGIDGWAGPYLVDEIYASGTHPRYGRWDALHELGPAGITSCDEFDNGPCATWLALYDVPTGVVDALDAEFDDTDGLEVGRVRLGSSGELLFYTFDKSP